MKNSLNKEAIGASSTAHVAGKIVVGPEVNNLLEAQLSQYATQVSDYLKLHPHSMLQYQPQSILDAIREAKTVLFIDPENQKLLAFCQIKYYGQKDNQPLYELQSLSALVGQNGYGRQVLEAGIQFAADVYPYARLLGIVASTNLKAQQLMASLGQKVGYKHSETIETPDGEPAFMHIYDITKWPKPELKTVRVGFGGIWEWQDSHVKGVL